MRGKWVGGSPSNSLEESRVPKSAGTGQENIKATPEGYRREGCSHHCRSTQPDVQSSTPRLEVNSLPLTLAK